MLYSHIFDGESTSFNWPSNVESENAMVVAVNLGVEMDVADGITNSYAWTNEETMSVSGAMSSVIPLPMTPLGMAGYLAQMSLTATNTLFPGIMQTQQLSLNYHYTENLKTEGKGIPGRLALLRLQVQPVELLDTNDWNSMRSATYLDRTKPISLSSVTVGGKVPSSDGYVLIVAPDNTNVDVTVFSPAPRYRAIVTVLQKYVLTNWCTATIPTDRARTNLGVGEEVSLKLAPVIPNASTKPAPNGAWRATAGSLKYNYGKTDIYGKGSDETAVFVAPSNAANVTVSATIWTNLPMEAVFRVYAPTGMVTASWVRPLDYRPGFAGVGMQLKPFVGPTNVCFSKVWCMEVGLDATNVHGYFSKVSKDILTHKGGIGKHKGDEWFPITADNSWDPRWDNAGMGDFAPTGRNQAGPTWGDGDGGFDWIIPGKWKVGVAGAVTNFPSVWTQKFTITPDGTMTVTKFGLEATRVQSERSSRLTHVP